MKKSLKEVFIKEDYDDGDEPIQSSNKKDHPMYDEDLSFFMDDLDGDDDDDGD